MAVVRDGLVYESADVGYGAGVGFDGEGVRRADCVDGLGGGGVIAGIVYLV